MQSLAEVQSAIQQFANRRHQQRRQKSHDDYMADARNSMWTSIWIPRGGDESPAKLPRYP